MIFATRIPPTADPRFLMVDFEPTYMEVYRQGALRSRVDAALKELEDCCTCPRNCHINRINNERQVYNTGAYDAMSSLRLLDGLVDIYMPDFKFWTRESARRLVKAKDYPQRARAAISEMYRQVGDLRFGPDGLARRGLLVRHLVMPGQTDEVKQIFQWLAKSLSPDIYINIMAQYRPEHQVGRTDHKGKYQDINRRPCPEEIYAAYAAAREAGLWRFDERW
jgi:putative pyruvate formate lyase activating enzyme